MLQEVPGIGDRRAKKIFNALGSLEAVAEAEPGYLSSIARVNEDTARKIIELARRNVGIE
jgi:ERCC4-type nuclease